MSVLILLSSSIADLPSKLSESYRGQFDQKVEQLKVLQKLAWPRLSKDEKYEVKCGAFLLFHNSKVFENQDVDMKTCQKMADVLQNAQSQYNWLVSICKRNYPHFDEKFVQLMSTN